MGRTRSRARSSRHEEASTMKMLWIASALFLLPAVGCGSSESAPKEAATSSTRIQLTAPGDESNALYRLGPATFRTEEQYSATPAPPIRVSTDVNADTLEVPLKQGYYTITLEDGWVLQS